MFQLALLIVLIAVAVLILQRQYSGLLVATPYAHLLYFLFVIYIGGFLLAPQYGLHFTSLIALTGFMTVLAALTGYFVMTADIRQATHLTHRFSDPRMVRLLEDKGLIAAMVALVLLTIPLAIYFFSGLPPTVAGVVDFLTGRGSLDSLVAVRDSRFALTKGAYFGAEYRGQGIVRDVLSVSATLLCIYATANFALKKSLGTIAGLVAAIAFAWVIVGGVGDRAPFLEVLIISVSAYSLCTPVRPRSLVILLAVFIGLVLLTSLYSTKSMALLRMGYGSGFSDLFWRNLERIFVGNSINDAYVIELVESGRWSLRYGAVHARDFITAIPGINYGRPVAYELFAYFNPYSDATTFFSGTYATPAFLDFGRYGATLIFFVCGCLVGLTERLIFLKRSMTGLQFVFVPLLSFSVAKIVLYGPTGLIAQMVVLVTVYGLMYLVSSVTDARAGRVGGSAVAST